MPPRQTKDCVDTAGASMDDMFACLGWCRAPDCDVTGGRNVSVVHDEWRAGSFELAAALRANPNMFKLRCSN